MSSRLCFREASCPPTAEERGSLHPRLRTQTPPCRLKPLRKSHRVMAVTGLSGAFISPQLGVCGVRRERGGRFSSTAAPQSSRCLGGPGPPRSSNRRKRGKDDAARPLEAGHARRSPTAAAAKRSGAASCVASLSRALCSAHEAPCSPGGRSCSHAHTSRCASRGRGREAVAGCRAASAPLASKEPPNRRGSGSARPPPLEAAAHLVKPTAVRGGSRR